MFETTPLLAIFNVASLSTQVLWSSGVATPRSTRASAPPSAFQAQVSANLLTHVKSTYGEELYYMAMVAYVHVA